PAPGGLGGPGRVVVSGDGRRAAVPRPGALTVVAVAPRRPLRAVEPPEGVIIVGTPGASLSADGKVLAYAGRGKDGKGEVVVWDVDKNEQLARVETAQAAPVFPLLSADGKTLATHGPPLPAPPLRDPHPTAPAPPPPPAPAVAPDVARAAQVWDVASGKELFKARVTGMGGLAVASAFSPDGSRLAVSAGDGPVDVWEVKTGRRVQTLLGRKGQGVRVAFSPDGKTVASVGPDYRIQRWAADGKPLEVTEAPPGILIAQVAGLAFADNERAIAWVTAAQFAVAWEAPTGRLLSPQMDHQAGVRSIAIPEGGKDLFTSGFDGRVFHWDFPTGRLNGDIQLRPARLPGQPLIRPTVNLSADATRAVWVTRSPSEVFDMSSGADLFVIPPPSAPPAGVSVTLSPDGMKVITACRSTDAARSGACVVWDLATQQRVAEFDIPTSTVTPIAALSPAGTRLAVLTSTPNPETGVPALLVTGFDVMTGKKLAAVENATAPGSLYMAVADETSAVVSSSTGRVWAVDFVAGRVELEIDKLPRPPGGEVATYGAVVFSPDGKRFAVGMAGEPLETYGVRVYDWPSGKPVQTFIAHPGPLMALRFGPDGRSPGSGAQAPSALLWDLTKPPGGM